MSADNETDGWMCYATGDADTRNWFERQWAAWPRRVDQACTTNLSFLFGGITAFRAEHSSEPKLSDSLRSNIQFLEQVA